MSFSYRVWVPVLLSACATCACAFPKPIACDTIQYNLAFGEARDQQFLLNAVRAHHRHPLFFTAISEISQSRSVTGGVAPAVPFGGGSNDLYGVGPTLSGSSGPSVSVQVLDKQDFMQGITKPVDVKTIQYYWRQGWPKELLLRLFVRSVEAERKGKKVELVGYPEDPVGHAQYLERIQELVSDYEWGDGPPKHSFVGAPLTAAQAAHPEIVTVLLKPEYDLVPVRRSTPPMYRIRKTKKATVLKPKPGKSQSADKGAGVLTPGDTLHLRSPEAILYHIGEIVRAESRGIYVPPLYLSHKRKPPKPLFRARRECGRTCNALVRVRYRGETWVIPPKDEAGESMHVLSLLWQLFSLHQSSKEIPSGSTIRVVN